MQLILFIGIPGTGKSSFYKERCGRPKERKRLVPVSGHHAL